MATSKVVTAISDLPYQPPSLADVSKVSPSCMEDIMKLMNPPFQSQPASSSSSSNAVALTMEELWKGIVEGSDQVRVGAGEEVHEDEISLEDFLANAAGAVARAAPVGPDGGSQWADGAAFSVVGGGGFLALPAPAPVAGGVGPAESSRRREKRRVEEVPMDRATLQKQRRMIKNRESAARSRQRKQAYTSELEAMVSQLEKENEKLRKQEVERNNERFKQLMDCLIPAMENCKCRQPSKHRRVNSAQW